MNFGFIFLFFLYFVNTSLCAENESIPPLGSNVSSSAENDEPPFDHSAFLQIDDSENIHIQNSKENKLKMRKLIKEIDYDKDSKISEQELGDWIEKVIYKFLVSEGEKYMPKIDSDEDSHATWDEYTVAAGYTKGDKPEPRKSSEKSKKHHKEKFDVADSNDDGKLSFYELGVMIHPNEAPHMSDVMIAEFLDGMDKDMDGKISAKEFTGGDPHEENELDQSFKEFDKDNSGTLERTELRDWLVPSDRNPFRFEAEVLTQDIDTDKNGILTEKEIFKHYAQFATSRATLYGRLIKTDNDDLQKMTEGEKKEKVMKKDEGSKDKAAKKKADDEL